MESYTKLIIISMCLIFSLPLVLIGTFIYKVNYDPVIPCLEEIAKDYCEGEGFYFDKVNWFFGWTFYCKEDFRQVDHMIYEFSKEEIKECKERK